NPGSALAFTMAFIIFCTRGNYPQISQIHTDSAGDLKSMSTSLCNLWTNLATVEMMNRKCP
ncbi:MAG TPA: hypothetical protein VFU08_02895, partial [Candidatus Udaeobacter sp.]|nr:hypothetical protein [Candidatus Udaeobacter sp.]